MKPDSTKRRSRKRRPDGHCGEWEQKQIVKAKELKINIKKVRKRTGKYMKTHPQHRHLKTAILLGIIMRRYGFSLRRVMAELHYRSGSREAAGLKYVPSKSWLHKWVPGVTDFTVTVTTNAQAGTRYSNIPKPVLVKLGNPNRIRFSVRGAAVVVESADG